MQAGWKTMRATRAATPRILPPSHSIPSAIKGTCWWNKVTMSTQGVHRKLACE